jgi:hypothetical protein
VPIRCRYTDMVEDAHSSDITERSGCAGLTSVVS